MARPTRQNGDGSCRNAKQLVQALVAGPQALCHSGQVRLQVCQPIGLRLPDASGASELLEPCRQLLFRAHQVSVRRLALDAPDGGL